jgi:hypothetical protein
MSSKVLLTLAFITGSVTAWGDAVPIGLDTATQGSWNGKYGGDGFMIANGPSQQPSYGSVSVSGAATFTWAGLTSDVRALQSGPGLPTRMASLYYANNLTINVSVNDGNVHPVALYMLDWDTTSRAQTVTVVDAATSTVLDTQSISSFNSGKYFSWNVRGSVRITVAATGFGSAAVSAIFFGATSAPVNNGGGGATASATPIGLDTTTRGTWVGNYGSDGYNVANGVNQNPSYGSVSFNNAFEFTWAGKTGDARALQTVDAVLGPIRTAATYYASTLNVNVNLIDGNPHQVSLYFLDWDGANPGQTVTVFDAASHTVLDTQTISGFSGGQYFSWTIKGNVVFSITSSGYSSALVSGVFFGAGGVVSSGGGSGLNSSATWVGLDTSTQGTWTGKYGTQGYMIANGNNSQPAYASAAVTLNPYNFTWAGNTDDVRALQWFPGSAGRIAAMYGTYKVSYFDIHVTMTDSNPHKVSLYLLDWDSYNRPETISIIDVSSNQVLDSRTFNGYHDGQYASWMITGNVIIRVTPVGEIYAALSAVFFD